MIGSDGRWEFKNARSVPEKLLNQKPSSCERQRKGGKPRRKFRVFSFCEISVDERARPTLTRCLRL